MEAHKKIIIYTDGGSRGNPGPAALGVAIKNARGETIKEYGEVLGIKTNNEAEYAAVVSALKKIKQLFGSEKLKHMRIEMRMDSQLVARQLAGEYKIENENLFPFFMKIHNFQVDHGSLIFTHVSREKNREADRMVNEALDGRKQSTLL